MQTNRTNVIAINCGVLLLCASVNVSAQDATQVQTQVPTVLVSEIKSSPARVLTLDDLVLAAVNTNPAVRGQRFERNATQSELDAANQLKWPTVNTSASIREGGFVTAVGVERAIWDNG